MPEEEVRPTDVTMEQLPEALRAAAARAGWTDLMPVQARGIPLMLSGQNLMIQARTGSGKTGAYILPMLERLDPKGLYCQALVLVPTRELARQVGEESERLCGGSGFRVAVVYGGVGYGPQTDSLQQGAQIVVGTPGRLLDLLLRRTFTLDRLEMLVYDEADRMLSMGFYPDMRQMQGYLPRRRVHTSMYSATFPDYVMRTAREFIQEPEFISLSRDHVHVTDTEHVFYVMPGMEKDRGLVRIIEIENPPSALIFCNTKAKVHYVSAVLQRFGYDADELSADLSQKERERVLERVLQGKLRFLVATDVAARGLDIPALSHVFQYEPPEDPESYIHRAGRTGRAGAAGVAVSLVTDLEKMELDRIGRRFAIDLQQRPMPRPEDVEAVVAERVTALLEARLRGRDKLLIERSQRFVPLGRALAENEDESAIIAMLLDDYYQQTLHAPVPQPGEPPVRRAPAAPEKTSQPAATPRRKHRSRSTRR
ncbi:MAG: DEAD/DEAH box helicase [Acidobacteria bacterium]|nr:DEAD/DEAH box helicase [Acidobacteriota bacterium]